MQGLSQACPNRGVCKRQVLPCRAWRPRQGQCTAGPAPGPWGLQSPRPVGQLSTKSCPCSLSHPGKASLVRDQGMVAMRTASPGGTGYPGGFAHSPRSNSEHERCVAIGTSLNTVTLVTTATRSHAARARPCAPQSGSPILHPRCSPPPAQSAGNTAVQDQQGHGRTSPHCQHHTIHSTTRAVGNHHQDQRRESDPSRVPWTSLEVCTRQTGISSHPTSH